MRTAMSWVKISRKTKMMIVEFRKKRVEAAGLEWGRRRQDLSSSDTHDRSMVVW
jgi:hypothetical protein